MSELLITAEQIKQALPSQAAQRELQAGSIGSCTVLLVTLRGMQCSLHIGSVVRICSDRKPSSSTCNLQRPQVLSRPASRAQPGFSQSVQQFRCHSTAESAPPAADYKDGRESYQPESFSELIDDACKAISRTIEAGYNRVEVEFPPLSSEGGTV